MDKTRMLRKDTENKESDLHTLKEEKTKFTIISLQRMNSTLWIRLNMCLLWF